MSSIKNAGWPLAFILIVLVVASIRNGADTSSNASSIGDGIVGVINIFVIAATGSPI